jgi:hypothetical protein
MPLIIRSLLGDPFITDGPGSAGVITATEIPKRQIQSALKLEF